MFSNFKNTSPPELSDDEIREVELKLKRYFSPQEIHAIQNSTWLRNAVAFIKKRQIGSAVPPYDISKFSEK